MRQPPTKQPAAKPDKPSGLANASVPDDGYLAAALKALGHPARVALLRALSDHPCRCGDLVQSLSQKDLRLAQSTVSQHLATLVEANLLERRTCGVESIYTINQPMMRQVAQTMAGFADACCSDAACKQPTPKDA